MAIRRDKAPATRRRFSRSSVDDDGDDVLDGQDGADAMDGGKGADTYYVDNPADVVTDSGDDGALAAGRAGAGGRRDHPGAAVVAWAGARGPVSGLGAFSIPIVFASGEVVPFRDVILATTFWLTWTAHRDSLQQRSPAP